MIPWSNSPVCIPIISTVLFCHTFAHSGEYKLQLVRFDDPDNCLEEFKIFDIRKTTELAIFHATVGLDEQMTANDVKEFYLTVEGCTIREAVRSQGLLNALNEVEKLASRPSGFTVLIGPVLPSDCSFVTEWIRQGAIADIVGLYQIQYNCRLNALVQPSVQINISDPKEQLAGDLVVLSMTIQFPILATPLNVLLRQYGWQRIAIIYEMSLQGLQNRMVVEQLQVFFSSLRTTAEPLNIVVIRSLGCGSHPSWYLRNVTESIDEADLNIYMLTLDEMCLRESQIFDLQSTLQSMTNYVCFNGDTNVCGFKMMVNLQSIQGCGLRANHRARNLVRFLSNLVRIANQTQAYTVFIGPPLGGDCNFVSNFIVKGTISKPTYNSLYQVEYCCRLDSLFRFSANIHGEWGKSSECHKFASLSVTVQAQTLVKALQTLLIFKHWEKVVIVYEVSQLNLHAASLAETIQLFLSGTDRSLPQPHVLFLLNLQWNIDPMSRMELLGTDYDAIILLARPIMATFFLHSISNMPRIREGRIAIIHLDPSSAITYDVLRFWRLALSNSSVLGAAGQSLFIMTALPAGTGYDASASILDSKIMVSAASAAAMAIRLTYLNLKANDGVIPEDTDFFQPLVEGSVEVPVLPNITYRFSREGDTYFDYYDFYFFSLSQQICNGSANSSQTPFDEIFELTSVIMWPLTHLAEVQTKIWPNGSDGPEKNYCMQTGCNEHMLWTAPELLREGIVRIAGTQKGDVYSFGIILQEILCCSEPFPNCDLSAEEIVEKVRAGDPPFRPEVNTSEIPYFYKNLMRSSWAENSDLRPTFDDIINQLRQFSSGE
nr:unnamed protein product [Spirometra erinaceieuropaei]